MGQLRLNVSSQAEQEALRYVADWDLSHLVTRPGALAVQEGCGQADAPLWVSIVLAQKE